MISAKRLEELRTKWKRLNSCHWINLHLRLDGQDIHEEGDWIKQVYPLLEELEAALKVVEAAKNCKMTLAGPFPKESNMGKLKEALAPFMEERP